MSQSSRSEKERKRRAVAFAVLSAEEMCTLLDSIDISKLIGIRDRAFNRAHGVHIRPGRRGDPDEGRRLLHPEAPRLGAAP